MRKMWKIVLTCILIYALSFGMTAMIMGVEPAERERLSPNETQVVNNLSHQPIYTVTEHDGLVAVYLHGESTPLIETDILVDGLRQNDRDLVKQGITLSSYTEVLYLLEDFGS